MAVPIETAARPARSWLITGASRGIGAATARAAAARGERVGLVARSAAVEDLARELREAGATAIAVRADLTAEGAADRIVAEVASELGGLDVLVNNAGLHRGGRIGRLPAGAFEEVVAADLVAPFHMCRAAVERMDGGGAIVNIGAVVGLRGFPGDSAYGSAKAGLTGLTQVLAIELARSGVSVNCVVPGFTETEMTAELDERPREAIVARIPAGRPARAEEVAAVVCWVSETPYMTGAIVPVDGGLMAALGAGR